MQPPAVQSSERAPGGRRFNKGAEGRASYTTVFKVECIDDFLERKEINPRLSHDEFAQGLPGNVR